MLLLIEERPQGPILSWALVGVLAGLAGASLLAGALLWTGFAVFSVAIVLVPAALARDPTVMPDWTVVGLVTAPVVVPLAGGAADWLVYLALAALALLVVVEIDAFSSAAFGRLFAIVFVVLTTMSVASLWAMVQYAADAYLGTAYLSGRVDLMWDLVQATAVGIGAGLLFEIGFSERSLVRRTGPTEDTS